MNHKLILNTQYAAFIRPRMEITCFSPGVTVYATFIHTSIISRSERCKYHMVANHRAVGWLRKTPTEKYLGHKMKESREWKRLCVLLWGKCGCQLVFIVWIYLRGRQERCSNNLRVKCLLRNFWVIDVRQQRRKRNIDGSLAQFKVAFNEQW